MQQNALKVRRLRRRLSYDLSRSPLKLKGLKPVLNLQNLTNKTYVSQCTSDLDWAVSSLTHDW